MVYADIALEQYPRKSKQSLVRNIDLCMQQMLRLTIAGQKKYYKKTTLQELDIENATLQSFIRLSHRRGFLPIKKYKHWSSLVDEIGRMVGGWIKSQSAPVNHKGE